MLFKNSTKRSGISIKKNILSDKILLDIIKKYRPDSVYTLSKLCKRYGYPRKYGGVKDRVQTLEIKGLVRCVTKFNKKLKRVKKEIIPL